MKILRTALILGVVLFGAACTTVESEIAQPKPRFTWEPPAKEAAQGITIALIAPAFDKEAKLGSYRDNQYLKMFLKGLQTDLDRTLLAKGFTVTAFQSLDEMTFPDKKAAPLALHPELLIVLDETYTTDTTRPILGGKSIEKKGTMTVSAVVKFAMIEPMSAQKIWLKKVDVNPETVTIDVDLLMDAHGNLNRLRRNKDNREAAIVEALNKAYEPIMGKFWSYLNAEEIRMMKKAADEVRGKKVF